MTTLSMLGHKSTMGCTFLMPQIRVVTLGLELGYMVFLWLSLGLGLLLKSV